MELSNVSTEKLQKNQAIITNLLKTFFVLGVIIAIMLCFLKAKLALFVPVFVLPITFLPLILQLKAIKDELKSRP